MSEKSHAVLYSRSADSLLYPIDLSLYKILKPTPSALNETNEDENADVIRKTIDDGMVSRGGVNIFANQSMLINSFSISFNSFLVPFNAVEGFRLQAERMEGREPRFHPA